MVMTLLAALLLSAPSDPLLPTIPPPLPTYIVNDDGTRTACAPNFTVCDWSR